MGDRLPDRADAEGARGAAVARGGRPDRQGRLPARGRARQGRSCRRELGLGQRPHRRARLRYAAGRQAAVPADANRARTDRRHRHRRRQDRAAADARTSAACSMRWWIRGRWRSSACCWSRTWTASSAPWNPTGCASALLTSISHDLKTPLASVLGAASHHARSRQRPERRRKARSARHRDRRVRAAQSLHRQSARHDQAGIRRHRAEYGAARCRRDRRQRVAARRQDSGASQGLARACRRSADAGARCGAVRAGAVQPAWTTRPNMRPPTPRYRSGAVRDRDFDVACRSSTKATAFRRRNSRACSTNSIARKRATMSAPAPASGWRFPAVLSRRCMARSRPPTAPTAAAPC